MEPKTPAPADAAVVDPAGPPPDPAAPPVGDLPLNPAPPPQPPPPPGRVSDSELAAYDALSVRLITEKQVEVDAAHKEFEEINNEAKALKTKHSGLVESLQALIRERTTGRGKPVQKTLLDVAAEAQAEAAAATEPVAEGGPDPLENLWREFPIDRLTIHGLTPKDVERLAAGERKNGGETRPILTMGQMADYTANVGGSPGYEQRLSDFKGIGPGGLTRICDAEQLFWRFWNNGGREEFAREMGHLTYEAVTDDGSGPAGEGGDGDQPGQPASPAAGADGEPADPARDAEARVYAPDAEAATDVFSLDPDAPAGG